MKGSADKDPTHAIDFRGLPARLRGSRGRLEEVVRGILGDHDVETYSISLSFVGDEEMARMNRERLGRSGPTDVIAFDLSEPGLPFGRVGDIYISTDTALANSVRFGVPVKEELVRLVVHGVLHVLGYRDDRRSEALKMRRIQERTVKAFQSVADGDEEL
jgi:probable rRNA maturation factor